MSWSKLKRPSLHPQTDVFSACYVQYGNFIIYKSVNIFCLCTGMHLHIQQGSIHVLHTFVCVQVCIYTYSKVLYMYYIHLCVYIQVCIYTYSKVLYMYTYIILYN